METVSYQEKWAWVDQRLEELYYGYGITSENWLDYMEAGLLTEMGSSVDKRLEMQYNMEFEDRIPCPAPICWVLYKDYDKQRCLEEEDDSPRSRAESDISDHSDKVERVLKRLEVQSPLPQGIVKTHIYAFADEMESLVSSNSEMEWNTDGSQSSLLMEFDDTDMDGYDSF